MSIEQTTKRRFQASERGLMSCGALLLAAMAGCGPAAEVRLVQPQLTGWQREIQLQTDQSHWARGGTEDTERVLAEFPLPGARTGRPTYLLYLRLPAGEKRVGFDPKSAPRGQGFFIQTRGEYAGLARLTGGTAEIRGASRSQHAVRQLRLDLTCEDGSRLSGKLSATRDEYVVSRFEARRRPADVQALLKPNQAASQPAEESE